MPHVTQLLGKGKLSMAPKLHGRKGARKQQKGEHHCINLRGYIAKTEMAKAKWPILKYFPGVCQE
jgi:hypothetical protein